MALTVTKSPNSDRHFEIKPGRQTASWSGDFYESVYSPLKRISWISYSDRLRLLDCVGGTDWLLLPLEGNSKKFGKIRVGRCERQTVGGSGCKAGDRLGVSAAHATWAPEQKP